MATFLFLVGLAATTLLLLASAAEEIVRVTRRLFARHGAVRGFMPSAKTHASPQLGVPPRAAAQPRPAASTDWVPDRAA